MNGRVALLSGLLVAQLAVVLLINMGSGDVEPGSGLLEVDPAAVEQIVIEDAEAGSVTLQRQDTGWQLRLGDAVVAADALKVSDVLERLTALNSLWPVASSSSSRERFEVSAEHYQRRLEMTGDDIDAVVYLGTSPGYRRVHASSGDSDNVYSIEFANYEVPTDPDEWLDKTLLQVAGISGLTLSDGWSLSRAGDGWLVDGQPAEQAVALEMINRVAQLRLLGVYQGDDTLLAEPRRLTIEADDGAHTWLLQLDESADEYVVTSSTLPGRFTIAAYIAEQILVNGETLLPVQPGSGEGAEAGAEESVGEASAGNAAEPSVPPLLQAPD